VPLGLSRGQERLDDDMTGSTPPPGCARSVLSRRLGMGRTAAEESRAGSDALFLPQKLGFVRRERRTQRRWLIGVGSILCADWERVATGVPWHL
jgi:hypothetical protein